MSNLGPNAGRGIEFEMRVEEDLRDYGCHVFPARLFSGADDTDFPAVLATVNGTQCRWACPDFEAWLPDGSAFWMEVKRKTSATLHRNTDTLEQGLELALASGYRKIEVHTRTPVLICFWEEEGCIWRVQRVTKLPAPRINTMEQRGKEIQMAYWPITEFREFESVAEILESDVLK